MKSKYHSNPTFNVPFFMPVLFVFLILLGTYGSVYGQWKMHVIDPKFENNYTPAVYDIEADGDMDIFSANYGVNKVFLYWNENMTWRKDTIDQYLWGAENLDLADFNDDGNIDVVANGYYEDVIALYMNSGGDPVNWFKKILDNSLDGATMVFAEDMNGDGAMDVVADGQISGEVVWYENNLTENWSRQLITSKAKGRGITSLADIDKDNKPDVLVPIQNNQELLLYRNNMPDSGWTEITIDGNIPNVHVAQSFDVDNDGDIDIVACLEQNSSNIDIVWYENQGLDKRWIKHDISTDLTSAFFISEIDFNKDGFMDFVATDRPADDVILFMNIDGGKTWIKIVIDDNLKGANIAFPADVDLDGDHDLVTSSKSDFALVWYENPLGTLHAQTLKVSPFTIQSQTDTLEVRAKVSNPENHPGQVYTVIQGDQTQYKDTLQLFDDGMHGDVDSSDNIWGNIRLTNDLPEDEYYTYLFTYDSVDNDTLGFVSPVWFFTLGPVEYDTLSTHKYAFFDDDIPNPGESINLKIALKNSSTTATATDLEVELTCPDSSLSFINSLLFEDIPAGQTSISTNTSTVLIDADCPVDKEIPISVIVSSHGYECWQDTFAFIVQPRASGAFEEEYESRIRIYPNPVNDLLSIETEFSDPYFIEISSLNGQLLYSNRIEGSSHQVDLSSFQKGVYLVKIRSNDFIETRKLIKLE